MIDSLIKNVTRMTWSRSMSEEALSALYLLAALQAWQVGIRWLAWFLFAKALNDAACSIFAAWAEATRDVPEAGK